MWERRSFTPESDGAGGTAPPCAPLLPPASPCTPGRDRCGTRRRATLLLGGGHRRCARPLLARRPVRGSGAGRGGPGAVAGPGAPGGAGGRCGGLCPRPSLPPCGGRRRPGLAPHSAQGGRARCAREPRLPAGRGRERSGGAAGGQSPAPMGLAAGSAPLPRARRGAARAWRRGRAA